MKIVNGDAIESMQELTRAEANAIGGPAVAARQRDELRLMRFEDFRPALGVIVQIAYPTGWTYKNRKRTR